MCALQDSAPVKSHSSHLCDVLLSKTWFGFDLDDTLHEFRQASNQAILATLESISSWSDTSVTEMRKTYTEILKDKTRNAFSDGKSSFDYRRERFTSLLMAFSIRYDEKYMNQLLDIYENTLKASLKTKPGAVAILQILKQLGKSIVVITEGPQDAQEKTLKALELEPYINFLATTNHFGVAKTEGLFGRVLNHLQIEAKDMAFIGDSWKRDMEPAIAQGIFSIHLDESGTTALDDSPPRVDSLTRLQHILESINSS